MVFFTTAIPCSTGCRTSCAVSEVVDVVAEHLMATTGQLFIHFEMATYPSLGIAGKVAGKFIQHPVGLPTALVEMWCGTSPG